MRHDKATEIGRPPRRVIAVEPDGKSRDWAALSPMTEKLLRAAASLERADAADDGGNAAMSEFTQIYREWITFARGVATAPELQVDQWQLLMHCMASATTLEEAIRLRTRFGRVIWGDRGRADLRCEGERAVLSFANPFGAGPEGLISAIWPLSLTLRELEFLGGRTLLGAEGRVPHAACLPDSIATLLFDRPLAYGSSELALVIPRRHLAGEVVVRAGDLPGFFRRLLPTTLGARGSRIEVHALVGRLIRSNMLRNTGRPADLASIAGNLGCSHATLRRRLQAEGWTFRQVKEAALDETAKLWLGDVKMPMEVIAERLGYSDAFAFRRFFRRRNGHSPTFHRRGLVERDLPPGGVDDGPV